MARALARLADRSAQGRMALVLEGGYDLVALETGLTSAIGGMLSDRAADLPRADDDQGVRRAASWAKKAWSQVEARRTA
jgi:acetoin utilization deacetylase AcuC-like enzyme